MALTLFVRLKLRILRNGFRGRRSRVLLFLAGILISFNLAAAGFVLFAASALGDRELRLVAASLGGAVLVTGAVLLPLAWFGVDNTLDPAEFALLPIGRWRLVLGLFSAALLSVPAVALLVATTGLLVPVGVHGGAGAVATQAVGLLLATLVCVAAGRAVTSAFAAMLRLRRVKELALVALACLAALLAPLQLVLLSAALRADWHELTTVAAVLGWTPLAAPYTAGIEMAAGRPVAAVAKLAIAAGTLVALLWWWSRSVESAMVSALTSTPRRGQRPVSGGPVAQLFPRRVVRLPATAAGALVARELRYWWRDARRRASLITAGVIGLLIPVVVTTGVIAMVADPERAALAPESTSLTAVYVAVLFVSGVTASGLANQFGYDGTSYASHVVAAVPGRLELQARGAAHALLAVPLLLLVGAVVAAVRTDLAAAPAVWGVAFAGYGCALAAYQWLSVAAPYALRDGATPAAVSGATTGSGAAAGKSMLAMGAIAVAGVAAAPVLVVALLLGEAWPWLALPIGSGYGVAVAMTGHRAVGRLLDRRSPEILAAVTPAR